MRVINTFGGDWGMVVIPLFRSYRKNLASKAGKFTNIKKVVIPLFRSYRKNTIGFLLFLHKELHGYGRQPWIVFKIISPFVTSFYC